MEEIFESEAFELREDEELKCPVLVWRAKGNRDDYRTPMMHAADMAALIRSDLLIVDRRVDPDVDDAEKKWVVKTLIPYLKKKGVKKIICIVDADKTEETNTEYPFREIAENFKIEKKPSLQAVKEDFRKEGHIAVSEEVLAMTKQEAIEYLGLPADANDFAIDDKFWQLSKRYRGDTSEEGKKKLADLSAAYDIATGQRDKREQALKIRESRKKFLGKTADEWKNYFYYTWYKYLIAIVLIILGCNLLYTIIFTPRIDASVVSIGHFVIEGQYYEDKLKDMGFRNPFINYVDMVVPNDQDQSAEAYSNQEAATIFLTYPNVIVTDPMTCKYYFGQYADCTELYNELRGKLSAETFASLTPIYCSEVEYQEIMQAYHEYYEAVTDEEIDLEEYSDEEIMIGIEIDNEDYITQLGYINLWPQSETALVFSINSESMNLDDSKRIITELLIEMDRIVSDQSGDQT